MSENAPYPIGTPGQKWGPAEKAAWFEAQSVKRSYADEVLGAVDALKTTQAVEQYGSLSIDPDRYPLFVLSSRNWREDRPAVLVTGGVHGYETSGVQGALLFLQQDMKDYEEHFNFVVAPCLSPWGYETINRWNPRAVDPNRSFRPNSPSEEAAALMAYLAEKGHDFLAHFDLHETTDTDNTEFRPALAARDAVDHEIWDIPDGFYAVGDAARPAFDFQTAIIRSVEKVTHIAPAHDGTIIGEPVEQEGVINYDAGPLGLCMGLTRAEFVTTTEVYPDSPKASDEICKRAQVAAIRGGLDYLLRREA